LWLAMNGIPSICTDLYGPSAEAIRKHRKYGVSEIIQYKALDAMNIEYQEFLNIICFKSVLGGIGRDDNITKQSVAIHQMYTALKPGGELWFAENLIASPLHRYLRKKYVPWGNSWRYRYIEIEEMKKFLAPFSDVKMKTIGFLGGFGRTEIQRYLFGHIDRLGFDNLFPDSWRYIVIGVAKKHVG